MYIHTRLPHSPVQSNSRGGGPLSREKSRDVLEQPPPILAKARRLQLADASFRDIYIYIYIILYIYIS